MQSPDKRKVYHSNKQKEVKVIFLIAQAEKQKDVLSQIDESDLVQFDKSIKEFDLEFFLLGAIIFLPLVYVPMYHQKNNLIIWLTLEEKYRQIFPKNFYYPLLFSVAGLALMTYKLDKQFTRFINPIVEKYDFIYEPQQTLQ